MKRILLTDTLHIRHAVSALHVSHAFFQFVEVSVTIFHFLIEIIIRILPNPLLLLQPLLYSMDDSEQRLQCLTLDCSRKTIIFNIKYVNMLINFTLSNKKTLIGYSKCISLSSATILVCTDICNRKNSISI